MRKESDVTADERNAMIEKFVAELGDRFAGWGLKRDADAVRCPCGGYAEAVEVNADEERALGCGNRGGCCSRAFVCGVCGKRLAGKAEAPEME